MPLFMQRSYQKELLDQEGIPFDAIKQNMMELDMINRYLGGHVITVKGIEQLVADRKKPLSIVEAGCGGGDNLLAIRKWLNKHHREATLTGIDINPQCIAFARSQKKNEGINFLCSDYRKAVFEDKPDIIFSSLFCHHYTEEELVEMLQWMHGNSKKGFFINDLHRHPLAYYSISILTKLFSKSYLVKNDAPISVLRGFVKKDWQNLFVKAGIENYHCQWKWAFRWLITFKHEKRN